MSYFVFPTFTLFSQRPSERAQSGESERHATVTGGMEIGLRDNCSSQTARVRLSSPKKLTVLQRISVPMTSLWAYTKEEHTLRLFLIVADAMATPEWKEYIEKHEQKMKDVKDKYTEKANALEVR